MGTREPDATPAAILEELDAAAPEDIREARRAVEQMYTRLEREAQDADVAAQASWTAYERSVGRRRGFFDDRHVRSAVETATGRYQPLVRHRALEGDFGEPFRHRPLDGGLLEQAWSAQAADELTDLIVAFHLLEWPPIARSCPTASTRRCWERHAVEIEQRAFVRSWIGAPIVVSDSRGFLWVERSDAEEALRRINARSRPPAP